MNFDPRAGISIISASECLLQGHQWEFRHGDSIETGMFLLHTNQHTYKFRFREGLCVADLGVTPELRNADAPPRRQAFAHAATVRTPKI